MGGEGGFQDHGFEGVQTIVQDHSFEREGTTQPWHGVRVLNSRYALAIVYRLMFFMYHKGIALHLPQGFPKLGYRRIMFETCC